MNTDRINQPEMVFMHSCSRPLSVSSPKPKNTIVRLYLTIILLCLVRICPALVLSQFLCSVSLLLNLGSLSLLYTYMHANQQSIIPHCLGSFVSAVGLGGIHVCVLYLKTAIISVTCSPSKKEINILFTGIHCLRQLHAIFQWGLTLLQCFGTLEMYQHKWSKAAMFPSNISQKLGLQLFFC